MFDFSEACQHWKRRGVISLIILWIWLGTLPLAAVTVSSDRADPPWVSPLPAAVLTGAVSSGLPFYPDGKSVAWSAWRSEYTDAVTFAFGKPVAFSESSKNRDVVVKAALAYYFEHRSDLGFGKAQPLVESFHSDAGQTTILLRPTLDGIPVLYSWLVLNLNHRGQLIAVKARGFGAQTSGGFNLSSRGAVERAMMEVGLKDAPGSAEKVWLPLEVADKFILHPAWKVLLKPANPGLRPVLFIDAANGKKLAGINDVVNVQINGVTDGVHQPRYQIDPDSLVVFPHEYVRAGNRESYTDLAGRFAFDVNLPPAVNFFTELRGRWVDVNFEDGEDALQQVRLAQAAEVNFRWSNQNSRGDERALFVHANEIHAFWKDLDPDFDALDYPVEATCEFGDNYDNAMWNGEGMCFGNGPQLGNLAYHADVIYHEYGHGVTQHIFPRDLMPYRDESGALNEAWSDYFPCSITGDHFMGENHPQGGGAFRNLVNDLIYPEDIRGEVHLDSRIISAAMWALREDLGKEYTDSLIHFARYRLGNDFISHFVDILNTDDDDGDISNGTPNAVAIYDCFGQHGIGPGIIPKLSLTELNYYDDDQLGANGDDDGLWETGETVRVFLEVFRDGSYFPPPAENVTVLMSCDDPDVDILQEIVEFGDMYVNDRRANESALLFRVSQDAEIRFANFTFTVNANQGEFSFEKTVRLPIGHPPILLVRDGYHQFDRTSYFASSLEALGLTFLSYSLAAPDRPLAARMSQFETVIWFTGDSRDSILSDASIEQLERFLDDGGNLLLTGQSVAARQNAQEFLLYNLGAVSVIDSLNHFELRGAAGDPVGRGYDILLLGAPGAHNQRRPCGIAAIEPAREIYHYYAADGQPAGGVRREDPETGSKTVFLSFGLEAVSGRGFTMSREIALAAILEWFGLPIQSAPQSPEFAPAAFELSPAYPNPFNGLFNLILNTPTAGPMRLSVYDLQGRRLYDERLNLNPGKNHLSLDAARWADGVYIIEAQTHRERLRRKALLLR